MLIEGFLVLIVVAFGSIFLLLALGLLKGVVQHLWGRWGDFFEARDSQSWVTTMGKIERAVVSYTHSGRGKARYAPIIRYSYGANGEKFVSERFAFDVGGVTGHGDLPAIQALVQRFRPGSQVEVHYDPKKPKRATLDRSVPPVVASTLGWLCTLLFAGSLFGYLGFIIVRGPFEDPPDLGETPPLIAQAGGFAVGIGGILLLVAGVRAIRSEERRQRRQLRYLRSAKPALVHEVREGELFAVAGRVEEIEAEPGEEDETAPSEVASLPFDRGLLVYYDIDAEWYRRTGFSDFAVRDASGVAFAQLDELGSMFIEDGRLPIEGAVERFLDAQRESIDQPIPAVPTWVSFRCIKKGEPVVVVGRAEPDEDGMVFGADPGNPESLLVATGTREEVIARLSKRSRRTRAYFFVGSALIIAGTAAMLVFG